MNRMSFILVALIAATGFSVMGFFIGDGLRHIKTNDRYVNVRGLSEHEVTADTAKLTVDIQHAGNEPKDIYPFMTDTQKQVLTFLQGEGLKDEEIDVGQWETLRTSSEDLKNQPSLPHNTMTGLITITTRNIKAAQSIYKKINDLRIKTNGDVGDATISYKFTELAPLRAEMIAAATKDARNAALQFAQDSGSKVGSIRNASQGAFEITAPGQDSDDPQSIRKNVRVVTTVDYELKD